MAGKRAGLGLGLTKIRWDGTVWDEMEAVDYAYTPLFTFALRDGWMGRRASELLRRC